MSKSPPEAEQGSGKSDVAALAGGSSWVFLGSMFEGGFRLIITWYLSGALGPESFGIYTYAVTIATLVALSSPLGVDMGILYFGARWIQARDRGRLKGYLYTGLGLVLITGPTLALALAAMGWSGLFWQDKPGVPEAVVLISPAVAFIALLLYFVFAVRSNKDMLRSTIAFQVVVPAVLLVGALAATKAGLGREAVIVAFLVANGAAMLGAAWAAWKHFGRLVRDASVKPIFELRRMVAYSFPQSVPVVIYRLNIWMDIMMLMWLGTAEQVGVYRVAVGLVAMVVFPVGAVNTMFSPQVTQLFHAGEMVRLGALLKVATRWMVIIVTPFYMVLVLEHRLILTAFDPAYMASAGAVLILVAGQAVHALCAPANRLIPMSGRSLLDMGISVAAVAINLTLNTLLIPEHGGMGAAVSGATTFTVWGISRVFVAYWLTGCQPFTVRTWSLVVGALGLGGMAWWLAPAEPLLHALVSAGALVGFLVLVVVVGRTPEDDAMLGHYRARLAGMLGRQR